MNSNLWARHISMAQWKRSKIAPKYPIQIAFKYIELGRMSSTGRVAQRITRLTTDQKIAGSNPAVLELTLLITVFILNLYVKVGGDIFIFTY